MDLAERRRQLGIALDRLESGQWQQTEATCGRLLAKDAVDVEALLLLGLSVAARGQARRAAAIFDRVARERPHGAHPCGDLQALLPRFSRAQIVAQYRACLSFAPEDVRLRQAFAAFLQRGGESEAALMLLREGLRLQPDSPAAHHAIGLALAEQGRNREAIEHFRHAVSIDPSLAASWSNLGMLLKVEGQFDRALAAHSRAVAATPNDPQIRVNRAVALLQAGRWAEAWPDYEWRLELNEADSVPRGDMLPALSDVGELTGRTVLLTHEEGFGDTIQYLRYIPLLARRGVRVLAQVPAPLIRLVQAMPEVAEICPGDALPPSFDFYCPFVSLPRAFGTTVETIPPAPYLTADATLVAAWRKRLPAARLRVGLAWAGQARPWLPGFAAVDRRRSAGLVAFAPLASVAGVQFVSLQLGPAREQIRAAPQGMALADPMGMVEDFADTAAIIANLDLVASVDTAVVHLAGALGKPAFLLDRYDNCWRWLSGRADSPWYPSLTIFRQEHPGDWTAPMLRAAAALAGLAAYHGAMAKGDGRTEKSPPRRSAASKDSACDAEG